jgi:putative inorganic carbon (hco3(-)) transporter
MVWESMQTVGRTILVGSPPDGAVDGGIVPALAPGQNVQSNALYCLRPAAIWAFLKRQPASYWFVLIYLFFEYVRPQQIYAPILGPPYARIAIILAFASFLMERRRLRFGTPELLIAVFSLIVLASSLTAFDPTTSYNNLLSYFAWVMIYLLIANAVDTEDRFLVFTLSFLLYSFKMSQFGVRSWAEDGFMYRDWGTTGAPGFFQNSGEFGIQMCVFLPLIIAFIEGLGKQWSRWMRWAAWCVAGSAVIGIVASSSRGAFIGCGAVLLWLLLRSRQRMRALITSLALVSLVYAITPSEMKARFEDMGNDKTSVSRTTYWRHGLEIMRDYPIFGIGYANWPKYYAVNYGIRTEPHNIFIQAGAELGYTGLVAFIALIGCTFFTNRRTRQLAKQRPENTRFILFMAHGLDGALIGFVASGFFVTVLYYPYFWVNFAMTVALHNAAKTKLIVATAPMTSRMSPRRPPAHLPIRGSS